MEREIIDYRILTASSPNSLEAEVKAHMNKEWQPLGGVAVVSVAKTVYYQSMAKYKLKKVRTKKSPTVKEPIHNNAKQWFIIWHAEQLKFRYGWSPKDAKKLNDIIGFLRLQMGGHVSAQDESQVLAFFQRFITLSYEVIQSNRAFKYVKDNFNLSIIESKKNELYGEITRQRGTTGSAPIFD